MIMDNENLKDYLKEKHPGAFEGWDGFELSVQARMRKGEEGIILVSLFNKGKDGYVVDGHTCFLMTEDEKGNEVIRVGKELAQEYSGAYVPEFAK